MDLLPRTVDGLVAVDEALAEAADGPAPTVAVVVDQVVPAWLAEAVRRVHAGGGRLVVELQPPAFDEAEASDGWAIGVSTRCLLEGVDELIGVDPRRLRRVRAIVEELAR